MPELPEAETIVSGLEKNRKGDENADYWRSGKGQKA